MEASTAGHAAAQGENAGAPETGEENGAPDIAQWQQSVDQQLNSANDTIRQLAEQNQQFQQSVFDRLPEPAAPPSFEDQFADLFGGDLGQGGYIEPQQLQGLQSLMQQQVQQGIQEAVAPFMEQMNEVKESLTARELQGLQTQFPELQQEGAVQQLADRVVDTALEVVPRGTSPQVVEALTNNAQFVALVHLAEKARGAAQQETPVGQGQPVPQIETGGGAAPTSTPGGDEWDRIANAGRTTSGPVW